MARTSALGQATTVEPSPKDRESTNTIRQAVAGATELVLRFPDGREVDLPAALIEVLRASADQLSAGNSVTVLASQVVLTPAEVGEMLGLSRPFVARLLDREQIPSEFLPNSRHRVVRLADVLAFQARRDRRRAGRQKILDIIEAEDLPY